MTPESMPAEIDRRSRDRILACLSTNGGWMTASEVLDQTEDTYSETIQALVQEGRVENRSGKHIELGLGSLIRKKV